MKLIDTSGWRSITTRNSRTGTSSCSRSPARAMHWGATKKRTQPPRRRTARNSSSSSSLTANSCDPQDVAAWGNDGPSVEESPVFIVGFPRSGTTLLEQVLNAHPLLQSMDEQGLVLWAITEVTKQDIRYPAE